MDVTFLLRPVSLQITLITAVQSARLSFYIHMYVYIYSPERSVPHIAAVDFELQDKWISHFY